MMTRIQSAKASGMFGAKSLGMSPAFGQSQPQMGPSQPAPQSAPQPATSVVFVDTTGSQIAAVPPAPAVTVVETPAMTKTTAALIGGGVLLGLTVIALAVGSSRD